MAYFDYNATTPLSKAGKQALVDGLESYWMNPSSPYSESAQVHNVLQESRSALARRLGKLPSEIVFTGGATEANNSILSYLSENLSEGKKLAMCPFEHPSVAEAATLFMNERVCGIKAHADGAVDLDHLERLLESGEVGAVSLMAVNNESGVVQPWQEVVQMCRDFGVLYHCDASQWFGKCEGGDFSGCDFLVGCAHKFGGPKGIGFVGLSPNSHGFRGLVGGGQEEGRRGGTENVAAILSMIASLEQAESDLDTMKTQAEFRDRFESVLRETIPEIECIGKSATRVSNTSFLIAPKFENIRWVRKLDVLGFQVSTGSACSTGSTHSSALLDVLGFPRNSGMRTIRVSSGPETSSEEWLDLATAFKQVWKELLGSDGQGNSQVISI